MVHVTPDGFAGIRVRTIATATDGAHHVTIAEYRFADGSVLPYIEMRETHDGARPGRVMSLSALVHLAQNVSDREVWEIGGRETPGGETV